MSEIKSPITLVTGAAVTAKRLVQLSSGEAIHNTASSTPIGTAEFTAADDTALAVRTLAEDGTLEMVASGAISLDADVYAAAAGKIQALPAIGGTYVKIGICREAATADGDIIQVLPYDVGETTAVDTALTTAAPAATPGAVHTIDSTDNAVDVTLAADTVIGRQTGFVMTEASNSSTVTVAVHAVEDAEVFTFDAVDETLVLMWTGTEYVTIKASATSINALTAAAPAITPGTINSIDSTSNAVDATLAADTVVGRQTKIVMTEASNSSTVTVAAHDEGDGKVFTFAGVDGTLIVEWTGTEYVTVFVSTSVDFTTLTAATPAIVPGSINLIDSGSNAVDATLADDTVVGRHTLMIMTEASASSTVTIASHTTSDPEVATFDAVGEVLDLMWMGTEYVTIFATATFV